MPQLHVTAEHLFKLVQQNIRLWARPGALERIYLQAQELAQLLDQSYHHCPDKVVAQLHLHKPHFDYLTNLTAKAAIFAVVQVSKLGWNEHSRQSIIAAALTANVAVLPHLLKQNRGDPLTDKQKRAVAKSAQLSYQLLKNNQVLDPLWLHAVLTSSATKVTKHYTVGLHGAIIRNAYRFAKPLCRNQSVDNVYVGQILRQLYIDNCNQTTATIVNHAAEHIHNLGSGALVLLTNAQAALLMFSPEPGKYLAFMFADDKISAKGRFVSIETKHIDGIFPLYQCDQPKLYSQLWEGPLMRYAEEKAFALNCLPNFTVDIMTPPKMLGAILNLLFENPNLKRISSAIDSSTELKRLLTNTATRASAQKIEITDTKHALAMLGLNRIGPLLIQGVLSDILSRLKFPGDCWLFNRQHCFIHLVSFYGKLNDLVLAEDQSMYGVFYLAPFFTDRQLQSSSYQLYRHSTIEAKDAFCPARLIGGTNNEKHYSELKQLIELWQLPKLGVETLRQLCRTEEDQRLARTVKSAIAVIRLAAFHCHTIFNQVDINNPLLQQRLREYLATLGLSFEQFLNLQDDFLADYHPSTPLF